MLEQMIEEDGLCIMSSGLGWQKVVAVMLRLQIERLKDPNESGENYFSTRMPSVLS